MEPYGAFVIPARNSNRTLPRYYLGKQQESAAGEFPQRFPQLVENLSSVKVML